MRNSLYEWWPLLLVPLIIALVCLLAALYMSPEAYYGRFDTFMKLCLEGGYSRFECLVSAVV